MAVSLVEVGGRSQVEASRLPGLDGLRAIAVILVYVNHFCPGSSSSPWWSRLVERGGFGVEIFFVLSGFLITSLLLREERDRGRISVPLFYLRRALRILPPLLAFLGFLVIARMARAVNFLTIDLVAGLFFFRNYVGSSLETAHLWTLAIEEQFYILWPIFLVLVPGGRARIAILVTLIGLSPLWRQICFEWTGGGLFVNLWRTDLRMEPLLIGALLAHLLADPIASRFLRGRFARGCWPLAASSLYLYLALMTDTFDFRMLRPIVWTLGWVGMAIIINCSVGDRIVGWSDLLNSRPMIWIGTLSYSLYLWQQPFASQVPGMLPAWFREFPVNLIFSIGLAACSYYYLERPFLELRGRLRRDADGRADRTPDPSGAVDPG